MPAEPPHSGSLICGRCGWAFDDGDKYCRECGISLQDAQVPVVRDELLPVEWRPSVPAAVAGGAALVAAGTIGRFLLGRLARGAHSAAFPAARGLPRDVIAQRAGDSGAIVSETLVFRRIRIRQ
jgi:hypothetical protein